MYSWRLLKPQKIVKSTEGLRNTELIKIIIKYEESFTNMS